MEKYKTLKDHVYDFIAEQIRKGALLPNERINENSISDELGISRTPVREALIQLSAQGILENKARKGFVVKSATVVEIRELYNIIGLLDGYAAKQSCKSLSDQDLKDMSFYIDAMDLAINNENYEMYFKQQLAFHQVYIEKCKNSSLVSLLTQLKKQLLNTSYTNKSDTSLKEILLSTNKEHRQILEFLTKGDEDGVFTFLLETHWAPTYAEYDMI